MDESYYTRILREWEPELAAEFLAKKCQQYETTIDLLNDALFRLARKAGLDLNVCQICFQPYGPDRSRLNANLICVPCHNEEEKKTNG